jgi:hypothetical protein
VSARRWQTARDFIFFVAMMAAWWVVGVVTALSRGGSRAGW